MSKHDHDFSSFESINAPVGSYEYQARTEIEKKLDNIQNQLNELRTEYENTFG